MIRQILYIIQTNTFSGLQLRKKIREAYNGKKKRKKGMLTMMSVAYVDVNDETNITQNSIDKHLSSLHLGKTEIKRRRP